LAARRPAAKCRGRAPPFACALFSPVAIVPGGGVIESRELHNGPSGPDVVLKQTQRHAAMVAATLLASVVVFSIVVELLKRSPDYVGGSSGNLGLPRLLFYAVAISMVFVTNLVHGFMLKAEKSDDIRRIAARLLSASIITTGLAETPLLLGFVTFVVWGSHTDFYILGFVSLYLILRHFPYYGQWEKFAKQRMGPKWRVGPSSG
jgi:hypothetical protein